MTKSPTCPTCGSINTSEIRSFGKENKLLYHTCHCEWWESKRKRSEITPQMAYEWFCTRIMAGAAGIIKMFIDDENRLCYVREKWWPGGKPQTFIFQDADTVNFLGWQDMPEMTRKDGE